METVLMPGSKNENRLSAAYPPSTGNLLGLGVRLAFFFCFTRGRTEHVSCYCGSL
jgi:hypothetical protein